MVVQREYDQMSVTRIGSHDARSAEAKFCKRWLEAAAELREKMYADGEGFDPLRYNETATVGLLATAAGRAGLLALPEFAESNRKLPEGRVRPGRCDLWLADEDLTHNWVMEFKVCWFSPRPKVKLINPLNAAIKAVFERDRDEADNRWACAIYSADKAWLKEGCQREKWSAPADLLRVAEHVDLAFRLDGGQAPVFFLLRKVQRSARSLDRCLLSRDLLAD